MSFISSHPGPFLMLAFLAVAIGGGALLVMAARRVLPLNHPIRTRLEALVTYARQNPERFGKQLQYSAFGLIMFAFLALTLIYS